MKMLKNKKTNWSFLTRFRHSEDGATAIEYGLIVALLAVAIMTSVGLLGDSIADTYNAILRDVEAEVPS